LRNAALLLLLSFLICTQGWAEDSGVPGGVQSFGITGSYSPDSSHIFIGNAEQRRTWTAGIEYSHLVFYHPNLRLDYVISTQPFFEQIDPSVIGTTTTINRDTFITPAPAIRVIYVNHSPVGMATEGAGLSAPIYPVYSTQKTYGGAFSPMGVRLSAFPRSRIQPTFSVDMGFVVTTRDIPVNSSDQFNYMFGFGPGVQIYRTGSSAVRVDYVYRHISNAHQGVQNPGLDQGVVRMTITRHW
jgi:hypothetical protein